MPVLNCMAKVAALNVVNTIVHDYKYKILVIFLKLPYSKRIYFKDLSTILFKHAKPALC